MIYSGKHDQKSNIGQMRHSLFHVKLGTVFIILHASFFKLIKLAQISSLKNYFAWTPSQYSQDIITSRDFLHPVYLREKLRLKITSSSLVNKIFLTCYRIYKIWCQSVYAVEVWNFQCNAFFLSLGFKMSSSKTFPGHLGIINLLISFR